MAKYWLGAISPENFEIGRQNDFSLAGFEERDFEKVILVEPGDRFAYYVRRKGFALLCTARSRCFVDWRSLWPGGIYPCRFELFCELVLPPDRLLSPKLVLSSLSFVPVRLKESGRWGPIFRMDLRQVSQWDFQVIEEEMKQRAQKHD